MIRKLSIWLDSLLQLLYPRHCYGCNRQLIIQESFLCSHCLFQLPLTDFHLEPNNPCFQLLKGRWYIDAAYAMLYLTSQGITERILYQLKYRKQPQIGRYLGACYAKVLLNSLDLKQADALIPVPLHPQKQRERGYNQSTVFAEGLAQYLHIPVEKRYLYRKRYTPSQTALSRQERSENVRDVFVCRRIGDNAKRHFLLVDDVLTTGATLLSAAEALRKVFPNCRITVVCLAMAK